MLELLLDELELLLDEELELLDDELDDYSGITGGSF
jgi:hypothetical protein